MGLFSKIKARKQNFEENCDLVYNEYLLQENKTEVGFDEETGVITYKFAGENGKPIVFKKYPNSYIKQLKETVKTSQYQAMIDDENGGETFIHFVRDVFVEKNDVVDRGFILNPIDNQKYEINSLRNSLPNNYHKLIVNLVGLVDRNVAQAAKNATMGVPSEMEDAALTEERIGG